MAAMTTVLEEHRDLGDSRVYAQPTHTLGLPRLCVQKRHTPSGQQTVAEDSFTIQNGVKDVDGNVLPTRASVAITVRRPINMDPTDTGLASAISLSQEFIDSDEFAAMVSGQKFVAS